MKRNEFIYQMLTGAIYFAVISGSIWLFGNILHMFNTSYFRLALILSPVMVPGLVVSALVAIRSNYRNY